MKVNITPSQAPAFNLGAWLAATTAGQPGLTATGNNVDTTSLSAESISYPLTGDRALLVYHTSTPAVVAQIVDNTGTAGSAVTISVGSVNIKVIRQLNGINNFLIVVNNDIYLLQCGASGTTVTSNSIVTDLDSVTRAETLSSCFNIIIAEDNTHFVVCNTFNNGGTWTFVAALWTLNIGTPSAAFVTRDTVATGYTGDSSGGAAGLTATTGVGFYIVGQAGETTAKVLLVTFTSGTVGVALTTISSALGSAANTFITPQNGTALVYPDNDICLIKADDGNATVIAVDATPSLVSRAGSGDADYPSQRFPAIESGAPGMSAEIHTASGTSVNVRFHDYAGDTAFQTIDLLTGLTTATIYASCLSESGNYVFGVGKTSTNTGQIFILQNVNG